jgi:hypothetical protein
MDTTDFTVTVPVCGNIRVRIRKDPIRQDSYLVEPAIWHPAVDLIGQHLVVTRNETPQLLLSDIESAMQSPMNLDAAIQYRKDRKGFDEKNARIVQISSGKISCCVCLEDFDNQPEVVRFMCYRLHWVCRTCYNGNDIGPCPLCRFRPFGKKYRYGVVQCQICNVNTAMFRIENTNINVCSKECAHKTRTE